MIGIRDSKILLKLESAIIILNDKPFSSIFRTSFFPIALGFWKIRLEIDIISIKYPSITLTLHQHTL